jgi:hypothetical protein
MLKKGIFIFSLGVLALSANANPHLASKLLIERFKNTKTCIVLEDGLSSYNVFIKETIPRFWKSTEYEFIDQQEFEKRRFDPKYSFVVLMKDVFSKDPAGVSYTYLNLVMGGPAKSLTDMPELCSIPIAYSSDNRFDYGYVVPVMVKFMQKHVKILEKKRFLISMEGLKYYNMRESFKDKKFLLNKDKLAPDANSVEKIRTVYPYNISLLSTSEIKDALASNPTNTLFNYHVGPAENMAAGKCFEMIFDFEGNLYYYSFRKITNENQDGFNLKDFIRIR